MLAMTAPVATGATRYGMLADSQLEDILYLPAVVIISRPWLNWQQCESSIGD